MANKTLPMIHGASIGLATMSQIWDGVNILIHTRNEKPKTGGNSHA